MDTERDVKSRFFPVCYRHHRCSYGSIKENILFGLPFDEDKYRQVIYDACLEADIAMLPQGENTPIGEKGVNLSGASISPPLVNFHS